MQRCGLLEQVHLFQRVVTHSNGPDFSLFIKLLHRGCCLFNWNKRVRPMNLIDVDIIGLQAAQRVINFVSDPRFTRVTKHLGLAPFQSDLRRNDDLFPLAILRQGPTYELFSASEPVGWSRIDERYPVLQRCTNRFERLAFISSTPHETSDRPGTQTDARYLTIQTFDCCIFHRTRTSGRVFLMVDVIILSRRLRRPRESLRAYLSLPKYHDRQRSFGHRIYQTS